jgi:DNA-binding transcriptional ArsR family regulator
MTARESAADLDQLATVVGRARARVLSELRTARTTEQIARELGAATSTVSEHLNTLANASLATRRRERRLVYYELSERGRRLLDLLSEQPR